MVEFVEIDPTKSVAVWALKADATGDALSVGPHKAASVTVAGILDGATVLIEGRNNTKADKYFLLNDPNGYPLQISSEKIEQILEDVASVRVQTVGGGPMTDVVISVLLISDRTVRNAQRVLR